MDATRGSVLIAAVSGRALARAVADAGYTPLVADFFADRDTETLAHTAYKLPGDMAEGFQWAVLEPALEELAGNAPSPPYGLVYGSGFEDRPQLLGRIAERWTLLGNDAATVARINDPAQFCAALDCQAIAHPETRLDPPRDPTGWIAKRQGGAGGSHIRPAHAPRPHANLYFQKLAPGRSVSALFAASGGEAVVLGFSEQWTAPAPGKPWRHGGAAQPAELPRTVADRMTGIVNRLASEFQLTGLNAADFILDGDVPLLLEINPRPGGTLDIFASDSPPLFSIHLDAVLHGMLPSHAPDFGSATASAILFAPKTVMIPTEIAWPEWAADLPKSGERIDKDRPICTLLARAGSADKARRLVQTRARDLLSTLDVSRHPERTQ